MPAQLDVKSCISHMIAHQVKSFPVGYCQLLLCVIIPALTVHQCMQVKLVDAGFIWTEPHSRRLKTKLTVQSEVFNGAILQQTFVVEYVVETHMCPDCSKAAANPNTWTAVVQVRLSCNTPTVTPSDVKYID